MGEGLYARDLAFVHDVGFDGFVRGAAPFLLERLHAAGIERGLVVDLGCGSGIWAAELLAHGYDVLGVDVSGDMLEIARRRAPGARFVQGSLHTVELPPCAAVTAIGEAVGYGGPADLGPTFARVAAALEPGGLFLFDAAGPGREPRGRRRARHDGAGWVMDVEVEEDRLARTLTRRIELEREGRRSEEVHVLRLYPCDDVLEALATAGFAAEALPGYGPTPLPVGWHAYAATRSEV